MEQFQIAFVHALAAVNGWRVSSIFPDYDGVDISISGSCHADNGFMPLFTDPIIHVQLKATAALRTLKNGLLSYDLEVKNYNQLIGNRYRTHRYMFLLDIPERCEDWCSFTSSAIMLRNKCYWVSLKDNPPTHCSWKNTNFGLTSAHCPNSLKFCGNGVGFRANLVQPHIL